MLDETHPDLPQPPADPNTYCLGRIGEHNVVIASLPKGEIGNNCSASVATRLLATFPQVRFGLMVGIGGGVPSEENDIRLGDVVVSSPVGTHGGVVQWDFGKAAKGGRFERTGALNTSPRLLRTAIAKLESTHQMSDSRVPEYIADMLRKYPKLKRFAERTALVDVLFDADHDHVDEEGDCFRCDLKRAINRPPREDEFVVHYGAIASGNKVIKDGAMRDQISQDLGGVLCFEMEAAGMMNEFPCLVVRGIWSQIMPDNFNLACRNWRSGEVILRALLRYQKTGILLSKDIVIAAAENSRSGSRLIIALINHQKVDTPLEEEVVMEIVRQYDNEVIEILFDRHPSIELTETTLVAAACNVKYEGNLMGFLLKAQGSNPSITQDVVEAAMRNTAVGFEIIELLVKEGLMIPVTKGIIRVAEENKQCGSRIIKLLLDRQQDVPISKDLTESFEIVDLDQGSDTLEEENTDIFTSAAIDDQSKDCEDSRSFDSDESSQDEAKEFLEDEDSSAEDIDLSNCRASFADSLDLDRFTRLRMLSLRQNRLDHNIFKQIPSAIKSLDLCDNLISCVKNTDSFVELRYLNLELIKIRRIEGLTQMTQLTDLYLGRNKTSRIQNLDTFGHLRHLDLTDNRIRSLENLDSLHLLQEIHLDKNKITEIKSLDNLINLRVLSLQSNRLTSMSGLSQLLHLEELYLGGNYITKISGLESCSNLRVLDIRSNHIPCLENIAHLEHLEELWASHNKTSSLEGIEVQLRDKEHLGSIDFKENPLETPGSKSLWLALPQVFSIDGATRPVDL